MTLNRTVDVVVARDRIEQSNFSIPMPSLPRIPRTARSRDPRGPAVSSSGTNTIPIRPDLRSPSSRSSIAGSDSRSRSLHETCWASWSPCSSYSLSGESRWSESRGSAPAHRSSRNWGWLDERSHPPSRKGDSPLLRCSALPRAPAEYCRPCHRRDVETGGRGLAQVAASSRRWCTAQPPARALMDLSGSRTSRGSGNPCFLQESVTLPAISFTRESIATTGLESV
jgi:hypothetical protein